MSRGASFGHDPGLEIRMSAALLALGMMYAVFAAALIALFQGGAAIVIAICIAVLLVQILTADRLALRLMNAQQVTPEDEPELHAMIDRLCLQADLPKPRVAISDDLMPNAFAVGHSQKSATVGVTLGLLDLLAPAELEGVLAHELAHIAHRDVLVMTVASFFASLAALTMYLALDNADHNWKSCVGAVFVMAFAAIVYAISFVLMQAISRYREYAADRGAAVVTGRPSALVSALTRIEHGMSELPEEDLRSVGASAAFYILPPSVKRRAFTIFATHPPTEKRIAALQEMEAELQRGLTSS